jgi:L-ascorbate metabolism protein UlaG (beta-lactamase superfamily)
LNPSPKRRVPPLLAAGDLAHAAIICGTHDHSDHIDRPQWPAIAAAAPQARFVVPAPLLPRLAEELKLPPERFLAARAGQPLTLGEVEIHPLPAAHELLEPDPATGDYRFLGLILKGHGVTLYHAGDTCLYEGLHGWLRRHRPDAMLLPINGRDAVRLRRNCIGNLTYQEAADLAGALAPRLTIPTHFEMFAGNTENPQLFADYMAVKYPHLAAQIPQHGEQITLHAR